MHQYVVVRLPGGGTLPEFPVQPFWDGGFLGNADASAGVAVPGFAGVGRTDQAVVNFLDDLVQGDRTPGLVSHLDQQAGIPLFGHEQVSLGGIVATGFFDVDVLAGVEGHHGHGRVPVVGRGDDDGVDGFIVEEAAEILISFGLLSSGVGHHFLALDDGARIDITDTVDLTVLGPGESVGKLGATAVGPENSNVYAVVRPRDGGLGVSGQAQREAGGGEGGVAEEFAAILHGRVK